MRYSIPLVSTALVTLLLSIFPGCTFTRLMTRHFEKPTFTYTGIEVVEASQSTVIVNFLFSAHNPNTAGLKNVTCSYELFVEGNRFAAGNDIPLELAPNGDSPVKVPATIVYADLAPALNSVVRLVLSGRKTIPISVDAVFSGKPAIVSKPDGRDEPVSFEIRLTKTADIPLPQVGRSKGNK